MFIWGMEERTEPIIVEIILIESLIGGYPHIAALMEDVSDEKSLEGLQDSMNGRHLQRLACSGEA